MRLRIAFDPEGKGGVPQMGKIFVVFSQQCCIIKKTPELCTGDKSHFQVFHVQRLVELRAVDRATAEGIYGVLSSTESIPEKVEGLFSWEMRLAETDGLGANLQAERVLTCQRAVWRHIHVVCTAHRCHAISEKTGPCLMASKGCSRASSALCSLCRGVNSTMLSKAA